MPTSAAIAERSPTTRSRVTNGSQLLLGIDGRSAEARRFRDLAHAFAADLGAVDKLTEAEKALCRQAAATTLAAERLQSQIVAGTNVDTEQLVRLTNVTTRLLAKLKTRATLKQKAGSSLAEYLASKSARKDVVSP